MFTLLQPQEHLDSLDESLIESASLESDLVTQLASDLSEVTALVFSAALESRFSASTNSAENKGTDHDFDPSISTNNFSLQFNDQSLGSESVFKSITPTLEAGTYFAPAQQDNSIADYGFDLSATAAPKGMGMFGSLEADTFTFKSGYGYAVFSGNGNVNYGSGERDLLDLSNVFSGTVTTSSILFDPGNGTRVFDSLTLSDGSDIYFEGLDQIQFADQTINLSVTPDDPGFESQWNLHMMGVHNVWRFTTGSDEVLVGVQDTGLGVDSTGNFHPDLGNTFYYSDNVSDEFFRNVQDSQGGPKSDSHGTGVQGIIAAASDNGIGVSGINWNSDVFNIDVLDNNSGDQTLAQTAQNMIDHASSNGQRLVINMSLGGLGPTIGADPEFEQLISNNQDNALFVIATGNDDTNSLAYPAVLANVHDNVIAVGASWGTHDTNSNPTTPGERISYPGWWGSNYGQGITLMGPSEVLSTSASTSSGFGYWGDGSQPGFNGTSAATPNVAGVASLVWSANSDLAADDIKTILSQTAYDLGTPGYDLEYGHGFVNADAAVRRAIALDSSTAMNQEASDPLSAASSFAINPAMGTGFDLLAV